MIIKAKVFVVLVCLSLSSALLPFVVMAQLDGVDYRWKKKKVQEGITIFTSSVAGSPYKAVRGTMLVKGSVKSMVALFEDFPNYPKWADLCKQAKLVGRVSDMESLVYIYNDLPFPVSDRDVYARLVWAVDQDSGKVSVTSTATRKDLPKVKGVVRLSEVASQWHFTPIADGVTWVESFAHINPNGPMPAWISNMLLVSSPYKTMKNMRGIIEGGEYDSPSVRFID